MSRPPVYNKLDVGLFLTKCERENGHQAGHLGTPQNNLGTPLGVPTATLGTPALINTASLSPSALQVPVRALPDPGLLGPGPLHHLPGRVPGQHLLRPPQGGHRLQRQQGETPLTP